MRRICAVYAVGYVVIKRLLPVKCVWMNKFFVRLFVRIQNVLFFSHSLHVKHFFPWSYNLARIRTGWWTDKPILWCHCSWNERYLNYFLLLLVLLWYFPVVANFALFNVIVNIVLYFFLSLLLVGYNTVVVHTHNRPTTTSSSSSIQIYVYNFNTQRERERTKCPTAFQFRPSERHRESEWVWVENSSMVRKDLPDGV